MQDTTNCEKTTQTQNATPSRRNFIKKAGAAAFVAPVVASYLVSDLVKSAKAQEDYGTTPLSLVVPGRLPYDGHPITEFFSFDVNAKTEVSIVINCHNADSLDLFRWRTPSGKWEATRELSGTEIRVSKSLSQKGTYVLQVSYVGQNCKSVEVNLTATGTGTIENLITRSSV